MLKPGLLVAVPLLVAAWMSAGAASLAAQAIDPVGRYRFESMLGPDSLHGVIVVRRTDGKLGATLSSNLIPTFEAKTVTLSARTLTIVGDVEKSRVTVTLQFHGDSVSGRWENDEGDRGGAVVRRLPITNQGETDEVEVLRGDGRGGFSALATVRVGRHPYQR